MQIDEILRHYSENGATNFKMINLKDVIIPNNLSKKHPKKQIKKLILSIVKLGYSNPIIITDNNVLISGYCRILAAQELEMTEIPAVVLSNITETDADAIRLLDNRLAEDSEWDFSVLKSEIDKLLKLDFELADIGFETIDYDQNHINMGKFGRYRTNVIDCPGIRATNPSSLDLLKLHPTVKSVPLIHDLILDTSSQNDIVLDCFGGSGSTLIAAERCKRRARIIEIDPRYCDVIIYRWQKETGKIAKFVKNFKTKNGEI